MKKCLSRKCRTLWTIPGSILKGRCNSYGGLYGRLGIVVMSTKLVLCVDRGCGTEGARIRIASIIGIRRMMEVRKIKKVIHIEEFEERCGYAYRHEPFCNGGHNCNHPAAAKETVNGEEVGYCYAFSCPLAPCADEQDFKDAGENLEEYEEDMYVVLFEEGGTSEKKICKDSWGET